MGMKQGAQFVFRFCREHPLGTILTLGILLRLPFIFLSPVHGDEGMYMYDAQLILKGSTPFADFHTRAPVFLYSLALFMMVFGENIIVARLFSLVVFVATTLVLNNIGKIIHSRRTGLLASGVFSFSPFAVTWSIVVETEIYLIFFVSLAALALTMAEQERTSANQHSRVLLLFALSGLLLGVSVFTRRSGLVVLPAFLFFIYLNEVFFVKKGEKPQSLFIPIQHGGALLAGFVLAFLAFLMFILLLTDSEYFRETFFSSAGVGSSQGNRISVLRGLVEHAWYLLFPVLVYLHFQFRVRLPRDFRGLADIFSFLVLGMVITIYSYLPYIYLLPLMGYFLYVMVMLPGSDRNKGDKEEPHEPGRPWERPLDTIAFIGAFLVLGVLTVSSITEAMFFYYLLTMLSMAGLGVFYLLLKQYHPAGKLYFKWLGFLVLLLLLSVLTASDDSFRSNLFSVLSLLSLFLFTLLVQKSRSSEFPVLKGGKAGILPLVWLIFIGSFYLSYNMLGEIYLYELMPPVSLVVALFINELLKTRPGILRELRTLSLKHKGHYDIVSVTLVVLLFSASLSGLVYANQELLYQDPGRHNEFSYIPGPATVCEVADYLKENTHEGEEILTANMAIAVEADRNIIMNLSHPSIYSSIYNRGFASLDIIDYPTLFEIMDYMNETRTRYVVYDLFLNQYYLKFNPVFRKYFFANYHLEERIDNVDIYIRSNHDSVDRFSLSYEAAGNPGLVSPATSGQNTSVVWEQMVDGKSEIYYGQYSRNPGDYLEMVITPKRSSESFSPVAALDSTGRTHVVWEERFQDHSSLNYVVLDQKNRSFMTLSPKLDNGVYVRSPAIAVDPQDRVHVVWTQNREGHYQIYYSLVEANGSLSIDSRELLSGPGDMKRPVLAPGPDGLVHLAYEDGRTGSYQVYLLSINASSANPGNLLLTGPIQLSLDHKATHPKLAVDDQGGLHLAWEGFDARNRQYIHYLFQRDDQRVELNLTDPGHHISDETGEENYLGIDSLDLAVDGAGVTLAFMMRTVEDPMDTVFLCRFSTPNGIPDTANFVFPNTFWEFPLENYQLHGVELGPVTGSELNIIYTAEIRNVSSIFYTTVPIQEILTSAQGQL